MHWLDQVKWNAQGLVPVVTQEVNSNEVLMLAWMTPEALKMTVENGYAVYWSRSRSKLWLKGETSGHKQRVREIKLDCDADAILLKVEQVDGIACHTGRRSCFFQALKPSDTRNGTLLRLADVIDSRRRSDPNQSYIAHLLAKGDDAILKKIGEEATEVVLAAKDVRQGHPQSKLIAEAADLWFHCLVMLSHFDLSPADVLAELERREGISGFDEKARRKSATCTESILGRKN